MKKRKLIIDLILIIMLSPLITLGVWSITSRWQYPILFPKEYTLRGFEYVFNFSNVEVLLRTIGISLLVVFITILISIPAAKAISIYEFRGKKLFEILIMSPIIVPMISVAMGIQITFIKVGISSTIVGVVIINILPCLPYAIKMISDTYKLVGEKLELQAMLLGANRFDTFRYVSLPLILPGIIGASSMCFIISFSQYFLTMLIGGGRIVTYPMIMFPYIQSGDRTIGALYSIIFLVISIIVLILIEGRVKKFYKGSLSISILH